MAGGKNPATVDASHLRVSYVLYVVGPDGAVGTNAACQTLDSLPAGQTASLKTESATSLSLKTTKLKLAIASNSASVGEKTSRSTERFGGGWVRVMGADGEIIGETKRLAPELAKLNPPWVGAEEAKTDIPMLKSLDGLLELLKNLPKPPGAPSKTSKESPGLLPPGFPPKP